MAKIKVKTGKGSNGNVTESALTALQESFESHAFKLHAAAEKQIVGSKECPQTMLRALLVLDAIQLAAKKLSTTLEAKLLSHAEDGGAFEAGKIAIQLTESSRTNISWKDEAFRLGEELAAEVEAEWDKKEFEAEIKAKYPATVAKKIKLTESL